MTGCAAGPLSEREGQRDLLSLASISSETAPFEDTAGPEAKHRVADATWRPARNRDANIVPKTARRQRHSLRRYNWKRVRGGSCCLHAASERATTSGRPHTGAPAPHPESARMTALLLMWHVRHVRSRPIRFVSAEPANFGAPSRNRFTESRPICERFRELQYV